MPKPLLITDYVDEDLKLVRDDDGTDTALQLSKDKLKIVGDLDVTGTIDSLAVNEDAKINSKRKLYLDGGGDTYISESLDDVVSIVAGDVTMLTLKESGASTRVTMSGDVRLEDYDDTTYSATDSTSVQTKAQIDAAIDDAKVIYSTEVSINALQMGILHSTEQVLVAAQGSGKVILPTSVTCFVDRNASTAQANSACDLFVGYDGSTSSTEVCYYARRFMYNEGGDRIIGLDRYGNEWGQSLTAGDNQPLTVKLDAGITVGSIDAMKVVTTYHVYDNS